VQPARQAVLAVLEQGADLLTARDVAEALGWTRRRAAMALLRAHRVGLARREHWRYTLSPKGASRLSWVRERSGR
jgi:prophage antirepressor-like protein